jgi:hypothetical protein
MNLEQAVILIMGLIVCVLFALLVVMAAQAAADHATKPMRRAIGGSSSDTPPVYTFDGGSTSCDSGSSGSDC